MTDNAWFMLIAYLGFLVMIVVLRKSRESLKLIISGFGSLIGIMLGFTLLTEVVWMGVLLILFNFVLLAWTFLNDPKGGKNK